MIEHTLYNMGTIFFPQKTSMSWVIAHRIFAGPGQILGWLQLKTIYFDPSKTAPTRPFNKISLSKQVFHTLWTRLLHIQKSKKNSFWPSYCKKSNLDNLLVQPSQTNKSDTDMSSWFFWTLPWWLWISMHISTTYMLQSIFLKE